MFTANDPVQLIGFGFFKQLYPRLRPDMIPVLRDRALPLKLLFNLQIRPPSYSAYGHNPRPVCRLTYPGCYGIMKLLLTVSEDRATRRRDLSAGTGVSGKGDANSIALFLHQHPDAPQNHPFRKPQSDKPRGRGGWSPHEAAGLTASRYERYSR